MQDLDIMPKFAVFIPGSLWISSCRVFLFIAIWWKITSNVCWSVCSPCHHGRSSILSSLQSHVSNSKTSFTAVHGTGLTGLHSARRIHCNVILAHSVIFIHLGGQRDRSVSRRATRCSIYQDINLSSLLFYYDIIMSYITMICYQNDSWIFATSTCNLENQNCTFWPFCAKNRWPTTQFLAHFIQRSLGRPTIRSVVDRP